eukprot:TRINITY_DN18798_c0_g1_i3.p1 TRINITY_DN18798_c0_g1~~TRINITY_DN18798_c0_g1_i3.p1  ORF type:complete len:451 (+),score=89.28 TRINITY_DN18798_c0_g1_i3:95-1447(+)
MCIRDRSTGDPTTMNMRDLLLISLAIATASLPSDLGPELEFQHSRIPTVQGAMVAHVMKDFAASDGAVCLDGSPGAFFFSPAANASNTNNWQIYFQGGGWCYEEQDCWNRTKTKYGSSSWLTDGVSTSVLGGLLSADCAVNPDFCNYNRVHMLYCDGNSFSGNRDQPVMVNDEPIYFRGKRIMDAVLKTLVRDHGLADAENVLLTGCSAGGLSTYLHADYVGQQVRAVAKGLKKYKAAPISGFFLLHDTVEHKKVYADQIKTIFTLANSSGAGSMNDACLAAQSVEDQWKCNFAEVTYPHIQSPVMPLNSALDSWQTGCIYTAEPVDHNSTSNGNCGAAPGWKACSDDPEQCSAAQMEVMNQYELDFQQKISSASTYTKPGNAAFIHSCHRHCEAQSGDFNTFKANGLTIQQAVGVWWNSPAATPAQNSQACLYRLASPHKCNPTCTSFN